MNITESMNSSEKNDFSTVIDIDEIIKIIPHRYPFLLVDSIVKYELSSKKIVGIKNVSINEPYFVGHFPSKPVVPGVLMIESMAQVFGILAAKILNFNKDEQDFLLTSIESAKFRKIVKPGDTMFIECTTLVQKRMKLGNIFKCKSEIYVNNNLSTEAVLSAFVSDKK